MLPHTLQESQVPEAVLHIFCDGCTLFQACLQRCECRCNHIIVSGSGNKLESK